MIHVQIEGYANIGGELKYIPSGAALVEFSVKSFAGWGDKRTESGVQCQWFGKRAESVKDRIVPGAHVLCVGTLESQSWNSPDGTPKSKWVCHVNEFTILDKATPRNDAARPAAAPAQNDSSETPDVTDPFADD